MPSDTAPTDIVVEVQRVSKTFQQRQREAGFWKVARGLFQPTYRAVKALDEVSLTIRRGEVVAYAGPNGAGKSTTVKLLSSLLAPDQGTVRVLGLDPVRDRMRYVGRIGVVFGHRTELWWDHPVAATFEWKRVIWNIPDERYRRMLALLKDVLGLHEFFNTLARELSLGQKMRAELALAFLPEPEVLFLDEATIGLDVLAKRDILQFIKTINKERGVTVMVTSHDMSELEELAGRIVMISRGRIAFDGDFGRLRSEFGDRRTLLLTTGTTAAPKLAGAELVASEDGQHTYVFEASQVRISALLEEAGAQTRLLDVETHRASIDDVIARIYERWGKESPVAQRAEG